jgi:hypothetical protein
MIVFYADGFCIHTKKNEGIDGVYVVCGNLDEEEQTKMDNIYTAGVGPAGARLDDCYCAFGPEILELQDGVAAVSCHVADVLYLSVNCSEQVFMELPPDWPAPPGPPTLARDPPPAIVTEKKSYSNYKVAGTDIYMDSNPASKPELVIAQFNPFLVDVPREADQQGEPSISDEPDAGV